MDPFWLMNLIEKDKFSNIAHEISTPLVYYGNACKICFKSTESKKCSSCKLIPYCSRNHETQDSLSHKSICAMLKTVHEKFQCTPNCTFAEFTQYRNDLASELNKKRLGFPSRLEKEVCEFPWVCAVCYSRENLNFKCDQCSSVVYCSLEHKDQDEEGHEVNCKNLKFSRIFDSIPYENGFKFLMQKFTFVEVPRNIKYFPKNMDELSTLVQNQLRKKNNKINDLINYYIHNDMYAPAATILYALFKIGILNVRFFNSAPSLTKQQREERLADRIAQHIALKLGKIHTLNIEPAMVIHMVAASEYEVNFQWTAFIAILTHWMLNVDYAEIILVGPALKECCEPDFSALTGRSGFQFHPKYYKEVAKKLPKPDLVILYNYGNQKESTKEFDERNSQRALFKHKNVPLIVTARNETSLSNFVCKLKELPNIQVKVDTHKNPFAEARPHRIWEKKCISTYSNNEYIAILTRN